MIKENFVEAIAESIRNHWDVSCFSDLDGETITYGDVANRIFKLHHVFAEAGINKADTGYVERFHERLTRQTLAFDPLGNDGVIRQLSSPGARQ